MKIKSTLGIVISMSFLLVSCNINPVNNLQSQTIIEKNTKTGTVKVTFDGIFPQNFKIKNTNFFDTTITKLKLEIKGLNINTEISQTQEWDKTKSVTFTAEVPIGKNRIVI